MAVAVKTSSEPVSGRLINMNVAVSSLLGAAYVLFAVGMVLTGIPVLWNDALELNKVLNVFLSDALLGLVLIAAVGAFLVVGRALEGSHSPRGLRAGAVIGAVALFIIGLITLGVGNWLGSQDLWIRVAIPVAVAGGLLYGLARLYARPQFIQWLGRQEDNGWFHTTPFKPNQGIRVRRGTVVGLLVLIGCGIYTMLEHRPFGIGDWNIDFPWNDALYVPILLKVQFTLPLILAIVLGWAAWRVVNWPVFADFLIATEAEMNKVSWTTRKRLVQDTVVVLVTVFLLTSYLFVVDYFWVTVLKAPFIRVLQIDPQQERARASESAQW
jgi:preprotein translocase SecE subunit